MCTKEEKIDTVPELLFIGPRRAALAAATPLLLTSAPDGNARAGSGSRRR
jgi:hypothetical protein